MNQETISAARLRARAEYNDWDIVFLGRTPTEASWDVRDALTTNRVVADIPARAYRCDCPYFATGGGDCIHIELVREYLARKKTGGQPAPAVQPAPAAPAQPAPAAAPMQPPAPAVPAAPAQPAPAAAPMQPPAPAAGTPAALERIAQELALLRRTVEDILVQLTPAEERERVIVVDSYVRSANRGGELVWLYGAHPGLQYRVAVVYQEDFPALTPYLDPSQGKLFDGEVAPSRSVAAAKGYLNPCRLSFEVVLTPTGRRTDNDQMIYRFKAARPVAA